MTTDRPTQDELEAIARAVKDAWEHFRQCAAEAGRVGLLVDIEMNWAKASLNVIKTNPRGQ